MNQNIAKLLLLATAFSLPSTLSAKEGPSGITAQGTCLKKIAQDRASVTLTTSVLLPTAGEASKAATKENQKLRSEIQSLKLENMQLETSNFSVYEEKEWVNKKMLSKGFRAKISLVVETSDISRIGEAIGVASKLGVKEIDTLQTFVSREKYKVEYENCLEIASKNAKDKALKLAKGLGISLGKVMAVSEGSHPESPSSSYSMPRMAMMKLGRSEDAAAPESAAPAIDAKPVDMSVSVTVTFDAN